MSRGAGKVQRTILNLIETHPDGAWSFAQLCRAIYPNKKITESDYISADAWARASKRNPTAERHAVGRAIARLKLPGTWTLTSRRGERAKWLYDPCRFESTRKVYPNLPPNELLERVKKAKRWRDATPHERTKMRIDDEIASLRYMLIVIKDRDRIEESRSRIAALEAEKRAL
jgi:hypothetical protein